jgi:hypothetical protein
MSQRLTCIEAFNSGQLLRYLFCNYYDQDEDYETTWKGHQPLTPDTWSSQQEGITANERRWTRRRMKRGCLSPKVKTRDTDATDIVKSTDAADKGSEWPVSYPRDLTDPHLKEWKN